MHMPPSLCIFSCVAYAREASLLIQSSEASLLKWHPGHNLKCAWTMLDDCHRPDHSIGSHPYQSTSRLPLTATQQFAWINTEKALAVA